MPTTVITGTSTGIGLATAIHLAREGHDVYATMRNPETGAAALNEVVTTEELPVTVVQLDVDDDASVRDAFDEVIERAGQIDVLVNNAGIGTGRAIEETPLDDFRAVMETNFFGALRCIQAVMPQMRERRSGCIVNVTSVAGRLAAMPQAAYASSKFALEALSEVLAQELTPFDVRVAIIEPGVILTPIFGKVAPPLESSHYEVGTRRIQRLFATLMTDAAQPGVVAEAIANAITTTDPKLRYRVGADADLLIAGRERLSDEQSVALAGIEDDEEYFERFKDLFGIDATTTA